METQASIATCKDGEYVEIVCGTQDPTGYQNAVAKVLGVPVSKVTVSCPRAGGGFGGKITKGITNAAASALATKLTGRTVRIFNTRTAEMYMNSGREGYVINYQVRVIGFACCCTAFKCFIYF